MIVNLQQLGRAVKRLQHKHHRLVDTRLGELGSSLAQWDGLRAISRNPEASSHALAEYTFQTDQAFGTLAKRLIAKGLVKRSSGGGRVLHHKLTPQGEVVLQLGNEAVESILVVSFASLSQAERLTLLDLISRLVPN